MISDGETSGRSSGKIVLPYNFNNLNEKTFEFGGIQFKYNPQKPKRVFQIRGEEIQLIRAFPTKSTPNKGYFLKVSKNEERLYVPYNSIYVLNNKIEKMPPHELESMLNSFNLNEDELAKVLLVVSNLNQNL